MYEYRNVELGNGCNNLVVFPAAQQDDPSTPLRLTKELEDFSLGSGSEQDSEPEGLVDDAVNSDIDGEHVTIDFPRYQAASFKDNQKSVDTSGPSLFSYTNNGTASGPSLYGDSKSMENFIGERERETERERDQDYGRRSSGSLQAEMNRLLRKELESECSANGYVGGRPRPRPLNGTNRTTEC